MVAWELGDDVLGLLMVPQKSLTNCSLYSSLGKFRRKEKPSLLSVGLPDEEDKTREAMLGKLMTQEQKIEFPRSENSPAHTVRCFLFYFSLLFFIHHVKLL